MINSNISDENNSIEYQNKLYIGSLPNFPKKIEKTINGKFICDT